MHGPSKCPSRDCLADLRATRTDGEPCTRALPCMENGVPSWVCPDCGHRSGRRVFETVAHCAMSTLAARMSGTRRSDPAMHADRRTSMDDWRVYLSLASGVPLDAVDRNGYRSCR